LLRRARERLRRTAPGRFEHELDERRRTKQTKARRAAWLQRARVDSLLFVQFVGVRAQVVDAGPASARRRRSADYRTRSSLPPWKPLRRSSRNEFEHGLDGLDEEGRTKAENNEASMSAWGAYGRSAHRSSGCCPSSPSVSVQSVLRAPAFLRRANRLAWRAILSPCSLALARFRMTSEGLLARARPAQND
jgi:hypothetical protein